MTVRIRLFSTKNAPMVKLVDTTDLSSVGQRCPCRFKSYWEYLVALVNYSHLKEGASCFTETACIKVSLNVEDVSPQALISVVPTVLYITL